MVFALNKKVDLKGQAKAFEDEKNAELELALEADGNAGALGSSAWAAMPFGEYAARYVERRVGSVAKATSDNERRYLQYVKASIGEVPLKKLTAEDVERCVLAVPRLSEEWANERQRMLEENRARLVREGNRRYKKPLAPIRVAGPAMQNKVLKFVREVLNEALDREHIARNVAKKRFLSKAFKKNKPLIDPLMEDEAERFLHEASMLPLGMMKVAVLLLFSTGMRPEEVLALRVGSFADSRGDDDAQVRIVAALRDGRIERYTKSDSSMRTVHPGQLHRLGRPPVDRGEAQAAGGGRARPEGLDAHPRARGRAMELQLVPPRLAQMGPEDRLRGDPPLRASPHVRDDQPGARREREDGVGAARARGRLLHARPVRRLHTVDHPGARQPIRGRHRTEAHRKGEGRVGAPKEKGDFRLCGGIMRYTIIR